MRPAPTPHGWAVSTSNRAAGGAGEVWVLSGEAGIGKTSVVRAFARSAAGRVRVTRLFRRCGVVYPVRLNLGRKAGGKGGAA